MQSRLILSQADLPTLAPVMSPSQMHCSNWNSSESVHFGLPEPGTAGAGAGTEALEGGAVAPALDSPSPPSAGSQGTEDAEVIHGILERLLRLASCAGRAALVEELAAARVVQQRVLCSGDASVNGELVADPLHRLEVAEGDKLLALSRHAAAGGNAGHLADLGSVAHAVLETERQVSEAGAGIVWRWNLRRWILWRRNLRRRNLGLRGEGGSCAAPPAFALRADGAAGDAAAVDATLEERPPGGLNQPGMC
eukprot:CAMPEP_0117663104 /NCGR_PEP_ID=MMETSP0804-20121206/8412_1 /TAXON_ID=1074897 /ORGANISM="Tetraselmis astigmatica, Strain CCMP880" /LENGTH=251 /DNA_ID=CAMNT_0005470055 /DNA_START=615 /DNA_END=1372 /DNA_ORIENTATION=+